MPTQKAGHSPLTTPASFARVMFDCRCLQPSGLRERSAPPGWGEEGVRDQDGGACFDDRQVALGRLGHCC